MFFILFSLFIVKSEIVKLLGHGVVVYLTLRKCQFSILVVLFYSASNEWEIQLLCIISNIWCGKFLLIIVNFSHSPEHVVVISFGFICSSLVTNSVRRLHVCLLAVCISCVCMCELSIQNFFPSWYLVFFFKLFFMSSLYNHDMSHFSEHISWIFSSILTLAFSLSSWCLLLNSSF